MITNPLKEGRLTGNSDGLGTGTGEKDRDGAMELGVINGRSADGAARSDQGRAKRGSSGDPQPDPNDSALEAAPGSGRGDPVHGSTGSKVPVAPGENEDEEGRSDNERLVDEGIAGAAHDQRLQAARSAAE